MLLSFNSGGGRRLVSHIDINPEPSIIALQANLQMSSAPDYSIVVHLFYEYVCSHPNKLPSPSDLFQVVLTVRYFRNLICSFWYHIKLPSCCH